MSSNMMNDTQIPALLELLGEENLQRIKTEFTEMLIDNIRDAVNEYYLFTPTSIDDAMQELLEKAQKEVLKERKSEITEIMKSKINQYIDGLLKKNE